MEEYQFKSDDLTALAEKFIKGKPKDKKTAQKLSAHLFSKGFSLEEINPVVKNLIYDMLNEGEEDESWNWCFGNKPC